MAQKTKATKKRRAQVKNLSQREQQLSKTKIEKVRGGATAAITVKQKVTENSVGQMRDYEQE
jgi:hydroxymethylglutaryl-CoA reductase